MLILVCVGAAAGCGPRRAETPPAAPPVAGAPVLRPAPEGAQVLAVDAGGSVITLRVYRAGRLAKLGHNHVITSGTEAGHVWSNGELAGSGFEVRIPVAALVIDDPTARAEAGLEFPGELPEAAREGTRRNMLRPEVLDGERHPEIVVRADSLHGTWEQPVVAARVTIKDRVRTIEVPLTVLREPGAITASGTFRIRQSDFGITPFSVGGGALQVADEIDVSFEIRASKASKVSGLQDVQD
ncbi:MAG: YceI family protein [Steroidobacteraceae bacterium]|nr:YceI family protein [Steroidobacteraceae bacterium]